MNESAARAERFDPAAPSPCFTWEAAGKPVIVRVPHGIVDRLEREAVESFRSLSSRGSEIGGVLLGRVTPGQLSVVSLEDYESVPCDYSRGPLYRLSEADSEAMARAAGQKRPGGLCAVGFFRSHTRKGLGLDPDDLELFRTRFADPAQIALLIRPFAAKPSLAGIFIWESGSVHGESSYLEFPFRASELASTVLPVPVPSSPATAGPKSAHLLPALPKAPPRAQIVPIASRRELPANVPPPPPIEPVPAIIEPEEVPPVIQAAIVAPPPEPVKPEAEKRILDRVETAALPVPGPPAGRGRMLWVLGVVASVLILAGLVLFSGVLRRGNRAPAPDYTSLALRVERTANELLLTWNRDSEPIRGATHAVLSIHDGLQDENVDLDLSQLRNGSIVYSPMTSDVVFQMKLTGKDKAAPTTASVRFLSTRPSPMAAGSGSKTAAPVKTNTPVEPPPVPVEAGADEDEKPRVLAQATRKFSAESLAQRLRPATATDTPEEPALPGATLAAATPASPLNLGTHALPAPIAPPPAPAPVVAPPAPEVKAPQGGQIKQAQVLHRKDPEYPRLAKESGAKGAVELVANIGADGKVKSVNVIKGHPLLQRAAITAVMQWVYSPAVLNGKPIESQAQIILNFVSDPK